MAAAVKRGDTKAVYETLVDTLTRDLASYATSPNADLAAQISGELARLQAAGKGPNSCNSSSNVIGSQTCPYISAAIWRERASPGR